MEAHHTSNPWTYLEVKRSNIKIKVTRPEPINVRLIEAVWRAIVTAQYLSNGKLQNIKVAIKDRNR